MIWLHVRVFFFSPIIYQIYVYELINMPNNHKKSHYLLIIIVCALCLKIRTIIKYSLYMHVCNFHNTIRSRFLRFDLQ